MKKVTLIIPDEFDKMLSIVIAGNRKYGGVNVAQRLEILDSDEITIDLAKELNAVENEGEPLKLIGER